MTSEQPSREPLHVEANVKHEAGTSIGRLASQAKYFIVIISLLCLSIFLIVALFGKEWYDQKNTSDRQTSDLSCINDWATQLTDTVNEKIQADINNPRAAALDALILVVANPKATRADFSKALNAYVVASAQYRENISKIKQPTAPQFTCFQGTSDRPAPSSSK